jgi:glc operon protein GlcG
MKLRTTAVAAALLAAGVAIAQTPSTNPGFAQYGPNITLDQARKVMAAAEAECRNRNWPMAIAIVDNAGQLVHFVRIDNTQTGSIDIALAKARTGAMFRRPGKALQDAVEKGGANLRYLVLPGAIPYEGGNPLTVDGKIVGGIGVSGGTGEQDGVIATAGVAALR